MTGNFILFADTYALFINNLKELLCEHEEAEGRPDLDQMVPVFLLAHVSLSHLWTQLVSALGKQAKDILVTSIGFGFLTVNWEGGCGRKMSKAPFKLCSNVTVSRHMTVSVLGWCCHS
jgi:hypothetical protein